MPATAPNSNIPRKTGPADTSNRVRLLGPGCSSGAISPVWQRKFVRYGFTWRVVGTDVEGRAAEGIAAPRLATQGVPFPPSAASILRPRGRAIVAFVRLPRSVP